MKFKCFPRLGCRSITTCTIHKVLKSRSWPSTLLLIIILCLCALSSCEKDECEYQFCYNDGYCESGTCICPYGYTGEHCEICTTSGYECVGGTCIYVECGATYYSLTFCLSECSGGSTDGYDCVSGNCFYTSSNAQYATLSQCENACGGTGSTDGYNCVSGNCQYVNSNAQYATLSACQLSCSSGTSSIIFVNNTHTEMHVSFGGISRTISPLGGTTVFTGTANTYVSGTAWTASMTSGGDQVGLRLDWNLDETFPANGTLTVNLNVGSDYFFLYMRNNGTTDLSPIYVNYGLQSETVDHVVIPRDNSTYRIGYYRAWSNSNVRAYRLNSSTQYVTWNSLTLPWTENQSTTLQNTLIPASEQTDYTSVFQLP